MNYIQNAWQFANIAYDEPTGGEDLFFHCKNFIRMQTEMDFAYWAEFEDVIVVGFRGTDTRDKGVRGIKTWLSNLDAYPLKELESAARKGRNPEVVLRASGLIKDGPWGKGTVHDGFYTMWKQFKQRLDPIIRSVGSGKKILITGHSRGGPCAELLARHLVKNRSWYYKNVQCVTFGAPAAGIKAYRDEFRLLGIRAINVINGYDIVPTLPPRSLGFRHGAYRKWMSQSLWHKFFSRFRDHFQENYLKRTSKLK